MAPGGTGTGPRNGPGNHAWSPAKRVAAVLAACAVLGGGTYAVMQATSTPAAARSATTQAAAAQAVPAANATEQAAVLQAAIATPGIRRLERLRLLGGMYGQFTYETKSGARTLAFERGTITLVGSGDVVVRATDGTTWTWALTTTSVVRENGTKEPESTLAQGQTVFAGGLVTGGTRDARLIVIRKAASAPKTSAAA
jgi:hypothetical protein